ncbi:MAG: hypothetical protein OEU54_14605 [Gemmatimonadota bacterium]|nr:hypothetical protein [Gemmatimonadota bacterium]
MTDVANGPGSAGSSAFSLVRFEREIFPFLQSTQWIPTEGSDERDRLAGAYDVVFPRGLLERMRRTARRFPDGDFVGLLYGNGCECPWTRRHWLQVEDVFTEQLARRRGLLRRRPKESDRGSIARRIADLIDSPEAPDASLLGWFRTRHTDALVMFASETEAHAQRFREPWQFSVLLPVPGSEGSYGVFGRDEDGSIRDSLARPFYEDESNWKGRRGRAVAPPNYRMVERATELPGSTGAWREVKRRKAPALVTAVCTIFGVALGLALSYELSRANQPDGLLAEGASFASPVGEIEVTEGVDLLGLLDVFDQNVDAFNRLLDSPREASTYCEDVRGAHLGVRGAFVTLIRGREAIDADAVSVEIEMAIQAKGRADARLGRSGCQ